MTIKQITALEPKTRKRVTLEYESIKQAKQRNPTLKDFRYVEVKK